MLEKEHKLEGQGQRKSSADSAQSTEPDTGLDLTATRSEESEAYLIAHPPTTTTTHGAPQTYIFKSIALPKNIIMCLKSDALTLCGLLHSSKNGALFLVQNIWLFYSLSTIIIRRMPQKCQFGSKNFLKITFILMFG